MASTYSTSLRLELMATGDQSGTWGNTTNTNLGTLLEQAITGYLSKGMADANQTLTALNGASDESRNMVLDLTGALTAARNVIVPTAKKLYLFKNSTTGGFAVTIKTSAGTGVAIPLGQSTLVYCDGTNVVEGLTGFYKVGGTDVALADGGTGASTVITAHDALTTKGTDVATAATLILSTATGAFIDLTGAVTVTAVTLLEGQQRLARAASAFQITVGASLIGNGGGANIAVHVGDLIFFEGYAAGVVRFWVTRASGLPVSAQAATVNDTRASLIVNGSMIDSQENTNTLGTTNGYYAADQFAMYFTAATAAMSIQRVQSRSLAGSANQLELKCTTAKASLGTSDYVSITQNIEGSRPGFVAAGFGSAGAKQFVHRMQVTLPAGLYHLHVANSAGNRHCSIPFAATGVAEIISVVIPGDTGGTWLTADGTIGMTVDVVLAAGATLTGGTASTWGGATYYAASTQFNILSSTSNVARLADVGVKLDPDATGVYGAYRVGEVDAKFRSERYLPTVIPEQSNAPIGSGMVFDAGTAGVFVPFLVETAKVPTGVNPVNSAKYRLYSAVGSAVTATSITLNTPTKKGATLTATVSSGLVSGNATILLFADTTVRLMFTGCRLS